MRVFFLLMFVFCAVAGNAQSVPERSGWVVISTDKSYKELLADTLTAVKANKMGVVTQAGPTGAAKKRGITIPGSRIIGVFNNVFAVRIIDLSMAAMIEAPVRLYVTEDEDGSATLSYKKPSFVFAPYMEESGADLGVAAGELDAIFENIANDATGPD